MSFTELVSDFAARHGIEGLDAADDAVAFDIDGIVVTLVASADTLGVSASVGEPPVEGKAAFADMLLEANMEGEVVFAKSRETGEYILLRRLSISSLDGAAFDSALEALVNYAEVWRRLLSDYRPAAATAAEREAEEVAAFGAGGFMQV